MMKQLLLVAWIIGVLILIGACAMYLMDSLTKDQGQLWMLVGTVLWLVASGVRTYYFGKE